MFPDFNYQWLVEEVKENLPRWALGVLTLSGLQGLLRGRIIGRLGGARLHGRRVDGVVGGTRSSRYVPPPPSAAAVAS
jgi:hypothetical protein